MRVLCCSPNGHEIEGEVVRGEGFDPETGTYDLESSFVVLCDDKKRFKVDGWAVDVIVLEETTKA